MLSQCEAKHQSAQPVLAIRTRTAVQNLPAVIGQTYAAIMQYLTEIHAQPAGMPFVAYYNMDMQDLDVEIGFPVPGPLPGRDEILAGNLPAGETTTVLYTGPYEDMAPAYEELTRWTQENGFEPTGVVYEYYLNGPSDTPPQGLQTQIVFMVKDAA